MYAGQIGGVWDALLGEGRNFWFFASSDWHNRGMFGPDDRRSSQDFFPGEYQRTYVKVGEADRASKGKVLAPGAIVDGLRTGNAFAASGQLIDRLASWSAPTRAQRCHRKRGGAAACRAEEYRRRNQRQLRDSGQKSCARLGMVVAIAVRDPSGANYSYTLPEPRWRRGIPAVNSRC